MRADSPKERVITKPRLVAAMLAEVDAAGAIVMVTGSITSDPIAVRLQCQIKVPFDTTIVGITSDSPIHGNLDCAVLFAGQRLHFQLCLAEGANECALPQRISLNDMRSSKRRRFGPGINAAEISTARGVVMAIPVDMSVDSLALVAATSSASLITGDSVTVRIRGDAGQPDIFHGPMTVRTVLTTGSDSRILLQPNSLPVASVRLAPRFGGLSGTIEIAPLDGALGPSRVVTLNDLSMTGANVTIPNEHRPSWLVNGIQVNLVGTGLTSTIVWCRGAHVGLKINGLDDPEGLRKWIRFIARYRADHGVSRSEMAEFASLLTQTGFLKGSRRHLFGRSVERFLPPEVTLNNALLYLRHAEGDSGGDFAAHIGMARLTDDAWVQQEGAISAGEGYSLARMSDILTARAREMKVASLMAPRYFVAIWDSAVKPSEVHFGLFAAQSVNARFQAHHLSLSAQDAREPDTCRLIDPYQVTAAERRDAWSRFHPILVDVFGGVDGSHPRLNAALTGVGSGHGARSVILADDHGAWGLAYRLSSYYALNASGMLNTVFIVARADTSGARVRSGLARLATERISFGTDDILLIHDGEFAPDSDLLTQLVKPKPYNFLAVDVLLNTIQVELDDPAHAGKRDQKRE